MLAILWMCQEGSICQKSENHLAIPIMSNDAGKKTAGKKKRNFSPRLNESRTSSIEESDQ